MKPILQQRHLIKNSFSPSDIAGLRLWLKADTETYSDSAGTQPATADGDVVGCWKDQSGNSYDVIQATSGKKPLLKLAANGLGFRPAILFDGIDDILGKDIANWLSGDHFGSLFIAHEIPTLIANAGLLGSADAPGQLNFVYFGNPRDTTTNKYIFINQKDIQQNIVRANTTTTLANTKYVTTFRSNGTAWSFRVNSIDQTTTILQASNTGHWFADVANRDNFTIGGLRYNTIEAIQINAKIAEVILYDSNLSGTDSTNVENYLNGRYGVW